MSDDAAQALSDLAHQWKATAQGLHYEDPPRNWAAIHWLERNAEELLRLLQDIELDTIKHY